MVDVTQVITFGNSKRSEIQAVWYIYQGSIHSDMFADDRAKWKTNPLCTIGSWRA